MLPRENLHNRGVVSRLPQSPGKLSAPTGDSLSGLRTRATLVPDGTSQLAESCIKQPLLDLREAECR